MKKLFYILPCALLLVIAACNNDKDPAVAKETKATTEKTADSLWKVVDDGHMVGMSKMQDLEAAHAAVQRAIDSVAKIPAASGYKSQLDSALKDLSYADAAMYKWMNEFDANIINKPAEERIKYLSDENIKVTKMKEAVLNSLAKAESVLKTKF